MVAEAVCRSAVFGSMAFGLIVLSLAGCTGATTIDATTTPPRADETQTEPLDRPDSRVGDLGQEDLPRPADLGPGWHYRVDHGNAEDGYVGSGQPATAREPESVLAAITPLGCQPARLPVPESALEVTYAQGRLPGVGLVLRFDDADTASHFFTRHARALTICADSHKIEFAVREQSGAYIVTTRTQDLGQTPSWTEAVKVQGIEVTLVAVADPTRAGVRSVVSALP